MAADARTGAVALTPPPVEPAPVEPDALVPRMRLVRLLEEAREVPLVLIVAPAGYGKSTLLTQWAAKDGRPFAWVEAPARPLAAMVGRALERAGLLETRSPLGRRSPERLREALRAVRSPFVLVVDDADAWDTVDEVLDLMRDLPRGSQIVVASRAEPSLPIGRLRTHRSLLELRWRDLAMTRFEAARLLDLAGSRVGQDDLDALMRRTEGWPAGLYMAAVSLAEQGQGSAAIGAFEGADYVVSDYISDELLAPLSGDDVRFLVRSSILDRLSGPMCDAVLGRKDSAQILRRFARSNLLVTRVDRHDECFRYHRLFADMLRAELHRSEPKLEPALERRASAWHEAEGDVDRALHHAAASKDVRRVDELLWRHAPTYLAHGRSSAIHRWLSDVRNAIDTSPRLALTAAHTELARGRRDVARRWLRTAERALDAGGQQELAASALLIRAAVCDHGVASMRADAERAEELLPAHSPWRAMCSLLRGAAEHAAGERSRARDQLQEGVRRGVVDVPDIEAVCLAALALLAVEEENWERAAAHALRARAQVDRCGIVGEPMSALVLAASALVRAQRGAVDDAKADMRRAVAAVASLDDFLPWYLGPTYLALARAALRLSDVSGARAFAARASALVNEIDDAPALSAAVAELTARTDTVVQAGPGSASPLTTAELRILQFLPTHLSFREIASRLYVSGNTVKTQAHAVYRKLAVSSRSEAVGRARTLGLLDG